MKKIKGPRCHWCQEAKHRGADGRFVKGITVCWQMKMCKRMFDDELKAMEESMTRGFFRLRDDRGHLVNEPRFLGSVPRR